MQELLFRCYRKFYDLRHIVYTALEGFRKDSAAGLLASLGHPLFSRFSAAKRLHPMSGGIGSVLVDSVSSYRDLRARQFGLEQVPLPKSLQLSRADAELNARVKLAI